MSSSSHRFQVEATTPGSRARAACFQTPHGEVKTPVFMPVGTQATVKSQTVEVLAQAGSQVLLANTYHLLLRPGREVFEKIGGIHRFMRWSGAVLTDSGGFQIFSLPHSRKMTEEGAVFQSYVDGRKILFTPELSIGMQRAIGSDIMMALDQCIPSTADHATAREAMELTHRWARRSLAARDGGEGSQQALFGIVQGACFQDLRRQSVAELSGMEFAGRNFDGFSIGGLAVGETKSEREDMTAFATEFLPPDRARYLMGVGTPLDILEAVHRGVDMFDCILPNALAQRGTAFTSRGKLQVRREIYKFSEDPLDSDCNCPTCRDYSRAYLHHLTKCGEVLGWQLLSTHNIYFYHRLMSEIRASIFDQSFSKLYHEKRQWLALSDVESNNPSPRKKSARSLGDYEIVISEAGHATMMQKSSGEKMHSMTEPMVESRELYVGQSRLEEKIWAPGEGGDLVLWDVGLGVAANAMAAIEVYEKQAGTQAGGTPLRELHLFSFENDLDSLRLARKHERFFTHLRHPAPAAILEQGFWQHKSLPLKWTLVRGDFFETFKQAPAPDLIYFDLFSPKSNVGQWTLDCFQNLFEACQDKPTEFFTYTKSTAVRAALLASGFLVARGASTGMKQDTTVAMMPRCGRLNWDFLDPSWLTRWERSGAKFPLGLSEDRQAWVERRIRSHEQFA